jgi:hypothetical protein
MPTHYIDLYFQRSHSHELDIQLNFKHHLSERQPRISERIFSKLMRLEHHALRWKRFSIITSSRRDVKLAMDMLGMLVLPRLQSLHFSEIGEPQRYLELPSAVFDLPVTTLRLDGVGLDDVIYPLSRITSLHLEDYRIHHTANLVSDVDIFREMVKLQSVILMGSVLDRKDLEEASEISLPSLSFLRISDARTALTFMDIVSAPLLRSLVLTNIPMKLVTKRAIQSSPPRFPLIHSLTITDSFLDMDAYTVLLYSHFHGLTHLAALDSDVEPIFTLSCTAYTPLLPFLHTLTLSSLPVSLLRPFIVDRCVRGVRPIRTESYKQFGLRAAR